MEWTLALIPIVILIRVGFEFRRRLLAGNKTAAYVGLPLQVIAAFGLMACVIGIVGMANASGQNQFNSFKILAIGGGVPGLIATALYFWKRDMFRLEGGNGMSDVRPNG